MQEGSAGRERATVMGQLLACTNEGGVTMNNEKQGCREKVN